MINQPWRLATNGSAIVCGEGEDRKIVTACPSAALFLETESGIWIERAEHVIALHNAWLENWQDAMEGEK